MSSACAEASTSEAISTARAGVPAFIAKVDDSASIVVLAAGLTTRLRTVRRNAVARSGSESIQNRFAAHGNAQAIRSPSSSAASSIPASTSSASRPRPCQPSA